MDIFYLRIIYCPNSWDYKHGERYHEYVLIHTKKASVDYEFKMLIGYFRLKYR